VPSHFITPEQQQHVLADPYEDVVAALEALAEALSAPQHAFVARPRTRPARPTGQLRPESLTAAVAAMLPEKRQS
jgi:hypothetical protein